MMRKLRLLMVEDSADDAELEIRALRRGGFEVSHVRVDRAEPMQAALAQSAWDVVIADYSMPHFNGLDALKLLRAKDPDLPFILVSGAVGEQFAVEAVKAGADDYILKPNLIRLCQVVERELSSAEMRRARRRIESRYRNLFNNVPVGVLFARLDGEILEANPSLVTMLGLNQRIGRESENGRAAGQEQSAQARGAVNFRGFIQPGDQQRFNRVLNEAETRAAQDCFDLATPDDRKVSVRLAAVSDESESGTICIVVADVSELKRAEEMALTARDEAVALAKLRAEFVANTSHEIRTPLNSIVGLTEMMLETSPSEEQRTDLEIIAGAAETLLAIVNNILNFSKLSSGKLVLERVPFEVAPVFEHAINLAAVLGRKKALKLTLAIDSAVPAKLRGDPLRFEQVLANLLGNAIKFTERGSVSVKVALESETDSTATVRCEVTDTGIGIAPEDKRRLFQPFSQVDGSVTRRFGGTGLGLAIASGLVAIMEGQIGVESQVGAGSTFWFTVRFDKVDSARDTDTRRLPASSLEHASAVPLANRRLSVLLAEDNPVNQMVANRQLKRLGCKVDTVATGAEAVEAASHKHYDVVLMDCQMPEMDGYEATRQIRRREGCADVHIKIVAMTAYALSGDREKCLEAGMDDFISKPVKLSELASMLRRMMPDESPNLPANHLRRESSDA